MTETSTIMETPQSVQSQVRIRFSSRDEDLALPETTGPILVPTGTWQILRIDAEEHAC